MNDAETYDALLLLSFGGPERPEDVVDFLENVTRGSGIPRSRLATVGEHYFGFGGKSPINDQNKALMAALDEELVRRGHRLPIYWGNRNWEPYIPEAVQRAAADGHRRVLVLVTSAYPSYSGCRSYREAVAEALQETGAELEVRRVGHYALDEGFVTANADALRRALDEADEGARVVFVTHSIPLPMDETSGGPGAGHAYTRWHREVAAQVHGLATGRPGTLGEDYDLVYCSRSGRPSDPWLEPDVNDHLAELRERGVTSVVLAPIGFISDHMEVIYDLDTQARGTCEELGISMVRSATAGTAAPFIEGIADRIERAAGWRTDCPFESGCGGRDCCPNPKATGVPAID